MGELASAGVRPEDIDTVFVTHLHVDHCGNCVTQNGESLRAAFPNATYRWTADEDAHWRAATAAPGNEVRRSAAMLEALDGRIETADTATPSRPASTSSRRRDTRPATRAWCCRLARERAFILGDAIACPAQLAEPEWSGLGDMDKALARTLAGGVAEGDRVSGDAAGGGALPRPDVRSRAEG